MKKLLVVISICLCELCYSQEPQKVFIRLEDEISYDKSTLDNTLKQHLPIDSQLSLEVYKEEFHKEENSILLRLHEKLGEYRILEGNLLVYVQDEKIKRINGSYYSSVGISGTTPLMSESEILEIAKNEVFGSQTGYDFQYEIEKVISKNYLDVDDKNLYYAYKVDVFDKNNIETEVEVIIDGTTGNVLSKLSLTRYTTQEKFSFVDDDMQWSYITVRNPEVYGPSYRITTLNKYSGDTIINGLQYKKMFKSEDNGETWSEIGYYRENEKIVYCIAKGESAEKVSYNFNIKPRLDEYYYIVVDSLTILEQKVPEYTFYWSDAAPSEYTYAVGTIIDELGTVYWNEAAMGISDGPEYSTTMLCVHKGNELLWQNPNFEHCYYSPYNVIDIDVNNSTLLQESEAHKYSGDTFDDDLHFQLKGNVLYISGNLELSCFNRGDWLLYTIDGNTITLEDDAIDGWIISKDRLFSLHSLQINGCTADQYNITFRGKTYSVNRNTSVSTLQQQIHISPNPVKDKLILTLPNAENEIKIFDLQGKLWLQQNVGSSAEINVSMLPTGTYVLVVSGESYKFVKE